MGEGENSRALSAINVVLVVLAVVLAALSLPDFISAVTSGGL